MDWGQMYSKHGYFIYSFVAECDNLVKCDKYSIVLYHNLSHLANLLFMDLNNGVYFVT